METRTGRTSRESFLSRLQRWFGKGKPRLSALEEEALQTPSKTIMKNFFRQKLGIIGLVGFIAILLFSFVGSQLRPINLSYVETVLRNLRPGRNYLKYPDPLVQEGVEQIASGVSFSVGLSKSGHVYVWGSEPTYLIEGVSTSILKIPAAVQEADIVRIAAGDRHALALDSQGKLYGWGLNNFQQAAAPVVLQSKLASKPVADLIGGEAYSAVLFADGELYVWGSTMVNRLDIIPESYQGQIVKAAANAHNMVLLLADGTVGVTGIENVLKQVPAHLRDGSVNIVDVTASYRAALALDDQGQLHIWGDVEHNVLQVPVFAGRVVAMDAGKNNITLLLDNGQVVYWGANHYKQLHLPPSLQSKR